MWIGSALIYSDKYFVQNCLKRCLCFDHLQPKHSGSICKNTIASFPPRNMKTSRYLFRHCQIARVIQIFHVQEYEIFVDVWLHASTFSSETKIYLFRFYFSFFLYSVYFFKSKVIPFVGNIAVDAWLGRQLTLINWLTYSFILFSKYSRNTFACCSRCKAIK